MQEKLSADFLNEAIKACFKNKRFLELCLQFIEYQYMPNEQYKKIWQSIGLHHKNTQVIPTYGIISQQHNQDAKVIQTIDQIKSSADTRIDDLTTQLELFVRNCMFIDAYDKLGDKFNKGDKDGAFALMNELGEKIATFNLKQKSLDTVFSSFSERYKDRQFRRDNEAMSIKKIFKAPTGIDFFDQLTKGGVNRGDTFLALAQSGVGKSKLLKHIAVSCARRGLKVLHIQGEGTHEECMDQYDGAVAGSNVYQIETAGLSSEIVKQITVSAGQVNYNGGEIHVHTFEQFDSGTMQDIYGLVDMLHKTTGIDVLIVDYLELFDPGDGKKYGTSNDSERKRREATAKKFKNICVEFDLAGFTATQGSSVKPEFLNDPKFVLTRAHISEFKALLNSFSYFITLNRTKDEAKTETMRIFIDKIRKYKNTGDMIYPIATNYDKERFYDRKRTLQLEGLATN